MWLSINAELIHFVPAKNQNFHLYLTFSTGWIFSYIYTSFILQSSSALTDFLGSPMPFWGKNQTGQPWFTADSALNGKLIQLGTTTRWFKNLPLPSWAGLTGRVRLDIVIFSLGLAREGWEAPGWCGYPAGSLDAGQRICWNCLTAATPGLLCLLASWRPG